MKPVLERTEEGNLMFECPGCGLGHIVYVGTGPGPRWTWNDSLEKPTFNPSLKVQWNGMTEAGKKRMETFLLERGRYPTVDEVPYDLRHVCHSFIRDGQIEFLSDCTHPHAGKTLPLPEVED